MSHKKSGMFWNVTVSVDTAKELSATPRAWGACADSTPDAAVTAHGGYSPCLKPVAKRWA